MFFKNTFDELSMSIPNDKLLSLEEIDIKDWLSFSENITDIFIEDYEEFRAYIDGSMKLKPFKNLQTELFSTTEINNNISLIALTVDEESGLSMGIDINLQLLKFGSLPLKHSLGFNLYFNGEKEAAAFKEIYLNYKRILELLLKKIDRNLVFNASGDDFYLQHNYNSLYYNLDKSTKHELSFVSFIAFSLYYREEEFIDIFKVFLALLDSTFNYASKRKNKDKILNYFMDISKK